MVQVASLDHEMSQEVVGMPDEKYSVLGGRAFGKGETGQQLSKRHAREGDSERHCCPSIQNKGLRRRAVTEGSHVEV